MDIAAKLEQIANERGIPLNELIEEFERALGVAYKRYRNLEEEVVVRLDPRVKSGAVIEKEVVGEVLEPSIQVSLTAARAVQPDIEIGDFLDVEVDPEQFGRIAANTFKQVLAQKLSEIEERQIREQFLESLGDVVMGIVTRKEEANILMSVNRFEVLLPKREQVPTDEYRIHQRMKVFVLKAEEQEKRMKVLVSRSHPGLLRRLIELEVPEIEHGIVEIKSIAREAGQRSKVAVVSHDERIDAVGACVGQRGMRIQAIMDELRPEKIDIVPWREDVKQFITNALSPAKVNSIKIEEDTEEKKRASVVVPDAQLSLAIGRGGQNVRLAARLTGWDIDIRAESQKPGEPRPGAEAPAEGQPQAEGQPSAEQQSAVASEPETQAKPEA